MFRRSTPATVPAVPVNQDADHDVCLKCGRPTPLGVSLCENDNPGRIKSPSTTQVHGTIVVGVLVGFGLLLLLFRFGASGVGPFHSSIVGYTTNTDGSIAVAVSVQNAGTKQVGASCRISDGSVQDYTGYAFFTTPIAIGASQTFTQTIPQPQDQPPMAAADLVVSCN
jgi:hypothetical protein